MVEPLTVESVAVASTTYEADYDLACATLRQSADEIHVVCAAIENGCGDTLTQSALMGIAARMEIAARIASGAGQ